MKSARLRQSPQVFIFISTIQPKQQTFALFIFIIFITQELYHRNCLYRFCYLFFIRIACCRQRVTFIFSRVHATLQVTLSVRRSVGWSVGQSVGRSVGPLFTFLAFFRFLGSQLLPKCHYKSFKIILSHSKSF